MSKPIKLKFYSDPGHGWVAVKRSLLYELNLQNKISGYSYQKGNTVYLEEDRDASLLIQALKDNQIEFTIQSSNSDKRSVIRSYESFFESSNKPLDYFASNIRF